MSFTSLFHALVNLIEQLSIENPSKSYYIESVALLCNQGTIISTRYLQRLDQRILFQFGKSDNYSTSLSEKVNVISFIMTMVRATEQYISKEELNYWLSKTVKNLQKGDADSLKKTVRSFHNLNNDFEKFRDVYFPRIPDMNIFHLFQLLSRFNIVQSLPREADRWKIILNLSVQQQWSTRLESMLSNAKFITMKRTSVEHNEFYGKIFEGFIEVYNHMKINTPIETITNFIAGFETDDLSYCTLVNYDNFFAAITYRKENKKNIIIHRFICLNGQGYLYNRDFGMISSQSYSHPINPGDYECFSSFLVNEKSMVEEIEAAITDTCVETPALMSKELEETKENISNVSNLENSEHHEFDLEEFNIDFSDLCNIV